MNTIENNLSTETVAHSYVTKESVPAGFIGRVALYIAPHVAENRDACVAEAAYFIAEHRGFAPGHELDDWLAAENDVDQRLAGESHVF